MKKFLLIVLSLLSFATQAQTILSQNVAVDASGNLLNPLSFFSQNRVANQAGLGGAYDPERLFSAANNVGNFGLSSYASYTVFTSRTLHGVSNACENLVFVWSTVSGEGDLAWSTNTFDLAASVEVNGAIFPIYFSGKRLAQGRPGAVIVSDPLGLQFLAGQTFWLRTGMNRLTSTSYQYVGNTNMSLFSGDSGFNTVDQAAFPVNIAARGVAFSTGEGVVFTSSTGINPFTSSGWLVDSGSIPASNNEVFRPQAVLALSTFDQTRSVLLVGDSISAGQGDINNSSIDGGRGWFRRSINATLPMIQLAEGGEKFSDWNYATTNRGAYIRSRWLPWTKYALVELGDNDLFQGTNVAQCQIDAISLWTHLARHGVKVTAATVLPRTTTTDSYTTTANQTVVTSGGFNVSQPAFNTWLRAGAPITNGVASQATDAGAILAGNAAHPLVGVLDIAAAMESTTGSGIWKAGTVLVAGASTAATTTTLTDSGASWGTSQNGGLGQYAGLLLWNTTRNLYAQITSNTATLLNLGSAIAGQTTGDTYKIVQAYTVDGTHPTLYGHVVLSGVVSPTLFP